jgi:twitching motility two-component system response regulator PilG
MDLVYSATETRSLAPRPKPEDEPTASSETETVVAGSKDVNDSASLAGIKVMVIDDSNTIRRSAEIFLIQAGCKVILAEDGFDALAKIADHQPDVIFVDIMMPRLDGYQTCALIKKNARFATTPVIMLSSKDGLFDKARGRMVGSDEYLTKPFTKDSLLKTVGARAPART